MQRWLDCTGCYVGGEVLRRDVCVVRRFAQVGEDEPGGQLPADLFSIGPFP